MKIAPRPSYAALRPLHLVDHPKNRSVNANGCPVPRRTTAKPLPVGFAGRRFAPYPGEFVASGAVILAVALLARSALSRVSAARRFPFTARRAALSVFQSGDLSTVTERLNKLEIRVKQKSWRPKSLIKLDLLCFSKGLRCVITRIPVGDNTKFGV